jgi:hypothetical protein
MPWQTVRKDGSQKTQVISEEPQLRTLEKVSEINKRYRYNMSFFVMNIKAIALSTALLLALLVLNTHVSFAQQDVEPGIDGLLDFQTNLDNIVAFVRYAIGSFSLSGEWIAGIDDYIDSFPGNAALTAGFYLSAISILGPIALLIVEYALILTIVGIVFVPIILIVLLLSYVIFGAAGLIGGYFVYSHSGESEMNRVAGVIQMVGGGLYMTLVGATLGQLAQALGLILQLLGMLGVA